MKLKTILFGLFLIILSFIIYGFGYIHFPDITSGFIALNIALFTIIIFILEQLPEEIRTLKMNITNDYCFQLMKKEMKYLICLGTYYLWIC